jgi:hypothetical protein
VHIFAIPASTAIDIVAIIIENILTLLNAEIIEPVTKGREGGVSSFTWRNEK